MTMTWKHGVTATLGPDGYDNAELFGPRRSTAIAPSPQAFAVQLGSDFREVGAHFHRVDQFQLMVGGSARFGGHEIAAGDLHYSDRFQPYGPFKPLESGMTFYTLRPHTADGVFYMPASRSQLAADLAAHRDEAPRRRNSTLHLRDVPLDRPGDWVEVDQSDAGMRVALWTASAGVDAPGTKAEAPGAYLIVIDGEISAGSERYGEGAISWLEAGATADSFTAACDDTRVVLLQYPHREQLAKPVPAAA